MKKQVINTLLDTVLADCINHDNWDLQNETNWQALIDNLVEAQKLVNELETKPCK